jgi:hypothetical protein
VFSGVFIAEADQAGDKRPGNTTMVDVQTLNTSLRSPCFPDEGFFLVKSENSDLRLWIKGFLVYIKVYDECYLIFLQRAYQYLKCFEMLNENQYQCVKSAWSVFFVWSYIRMHIWVCVDVSRYCAE